MNCGRADALGKFCGGKAIVYVGIARVDVVQLPLDLRFDVVFKPSRFGIDIIGKSRSNVDHYGQRNVRSIDGPHLIQRKFGDVVRLWQLGVTGSCLAAACRLVFPRMREVFRGAGQLKGARDFEIARILGALQQLLWQLDRSRDRIGPENVVASSVGSQGRNEYVASTCTFRLRFEEVVTCAVELGQMFYLLCKTFGVKEAMMKQS